MVGPFDVKQKMEMSQPDATLTMVPLTLTLTFDLKLSRSNCISGVGGPIVIQLKRRESIECPDVNIKEMSQLDAALTGIPLSLIFDLEISRSNGISGMGGLIVMEPKRRESIGCPDVKH